MNAYNEDGITALCYQKCHAKWQRNIPCVDQTPLSASVIRDSWVLSKLFIKTCRASLKLRLKRLSDSYDLLREVNAFVIILTYSMAQSFLRS